jgi:glycosyltransferase involved in cell wall biosynthesis
LAVTTLDIMLPCYGDIDLLKAAVRSVLAQTDDNWYLTVIDDGDHPELPGWFESLAHPRVSYSRNERNLGITANFQKCLDAVTREYAVIFGADDIMKPDYVATVRQLVERYPQVAIIQPGVEVIDETGTPRKTLVDYAKQRLYRPPVRGEVILEGEKLAARLLRGNWMYFPALCWRSSAFKSVGFDQRFVVIQDLGAALPLIEDGGQLLVSDKVVFQYRRHSQSVSSAQAIRGSRFVEERSFFVEVAARMQARGWKRAARAARLHDSSRLHALTLLPSALRRRELRGVGVLLNHALRPMTRHSRAEAASTTPVAS